MLVIAEIVRRRGALRGATEFRLLCVAVAVYVAGYAVELGAPDIPGVMSALKVEYLGVAVVPGLTLLSVVALSGRSRDTSPLNVALLFAIPATTWLLVLTNESHQLVWRAIELDTSLGTVLVAAAQDLVRAGQTDGAIKLLRGGVARQGRNVAIIVPLVQLLAARQPPSRDDLDEAIRLGEHAVALTKSSDPLPLLALAAAQHAAGRDDLAAAAARQALRVTPPERGDLARQINVILNEYERAPRR